MISGIAPSMFAAIVVLTPAQPNEISSRTRQCARQRPRPPYASGISQFISPVSHAFLQISVGNVPFSSSSPATGTISLRVNSRAVSINCFSSSENSKLGILGSIAPDPGVTCRFCADA